MIKRRDLLGPFKVAMNGLVYTFKTQRHMRVHLYVVITIVLLGVLFNLGLREVLLLLFMISLVLVAEMFNSAIEATVDLVQPNYHPLAKFAKDIAAGAVLITSIIAIVVAALMLLGENRWEEIKINLTSETINVPAAPRLIIGVFVLLIVVVIGKGLGSRGQVLKGGLVSGHAALGFFGAVSILLLTDQFIVGVIAIILAGLIAQSRWEKRIHSVFELTLGAAVGSLLALVLFGFLPK